MALLVAPPAGPTPPVAAPPATVLVPPVALLEVLEAPPLLTPPLLVLPPVWLLACVLPPVAGLLTIEVMPPAARVPPTAALPPMLSAPPVVNPELPPAAKPLVVTPEVVPPEFAVFVPALPVLPPVLDPPPNAATPPVAEVSPADVLEPPQATSADVAAKRNGSRKCFQQIGRALSGDMQLIVLCSRQACTSPSRNRRTEQLLRRKAAKSRVDFVRLQTQPVERTFTILRREKCPGGKVRLFAFTRVKDAIPVERCETSVTVRLAVAGANGCVIGVTCQRPWFANGLSICRAAVSARFVRTVFTLQAGIARPTTASCVVLGWRAAEAALVPALGSDHPQRNATRAVFLRSHC